MRCSVEVGRLTVYRTWQPNFPEDVSVGSGAYGLAEIAGRSTGWPRGRAASTVTAASTGKSIRISL